MKKSINRRTVLSSILGYFLTKPLYAKLLCPITPSQPKGPFYKKNILNVLDMTNKGKAENKDKMKTRIAEKGTFKKKSKLDADTVASYKKRIKYMKDRKAKGKNFSAKNLKELEAKLAAN